MKSRPLTALEHEALLRLHQGSPWGVDSRTARGLRIRGLVVLYQHRSLLLPALTATGAAIAAEIFAEATASARPTRAPHLRLISNPANTEAYHV